MEAGYWGPVPWFLDPEREEADGDEWSALGLPLELRETANAALRKIYPPEYVRALAAEPVVAGSAGRLLRFGGIVRLFRGIMIPGGVAPLLNLGVDGDRIQAWKDRHLVTRLQRHEQFAGAAFEARLHAAVRRGGGRVLPVPTGQTKTHDFIIEFRGQLFDVEAKLVGSSDVDRFAERFQHRLISADLMVPGFHVRLHGSQALSDLVLGHLDEAEAQLQAILNTFAAAAAQARAAPRIGVFEAPPWGTLELAPGPVGGMLENLGIPDVPPEKRATTVAAAIRRKLNQLSGSRPGIIVLGLFGEAQPDDVQRLVLQDVESAADLARKCRMVVLLDQFMQPDPLGRRGPARYPAYYAFSPLHTRKLDRRDRRLAEVIASPHWGRAFPVDWEREGHISTRHSARRPVHTTSHAGRLTLPAGAGSTARASFQRVNGLWVLVPVDEESDSA